MTSIQLLKLAVLHFASVFGQVAASEADSAGWMLVSTVNLLAAEGETLVEVSTVHRTQHTAHCTQDTAHCTSV